MHNKFLESFRRSGRTTRMIEHAENLAKECQDRVVYILFLDEPQAKEQLIKFGKSKAEKLGIKFESIHSHRTFDWNTMRSRTNHPNCKFLVDHFVIEQKLNDDHEPI